MLFAQHQKLQAYTLHQMGQPILWLPFAQERLSVTTFTAGRAKTNAVHQGCMKPGMSTRSPMCMRQRAFFMLAVMQRGDSLACCARGGSESRDT